MAPDVKSLKEKKTYSVLVRSHLPHKWDNDLKETGSSVTARWVFFSFRDRLELVAATSSLHRWMGGNLSPQSCRLIGKGLQIILTTYKRRQISNTVEHFRQVQLICNLSLLSRGLHSTGCQRSHYSLSPVSKEAAEHQCCLWGNFSFRSMSFWLDCEWKRLMWISVYVDSNR